MPTTYAHYAFGHDVFTLLAPGTQRTLLPFLDMYDIGVHGPDIIFYYRAYRKNRINQRGVSIHHAPGKDFFSHAFAVYRRQRNKGMARAYLAGALTHFVLDSACHPYIEKRVRETGISHTEIETDFDMLLMRKAGLEPQRYHTAAHIHPSPGRASVIAPYYGIRRGQCLEAMIEMKGILDVVFHSSFGLKRRFLGWFGRNYYPTLSLAHYFVKPEMNPANDETCRVLLGKYRACQEECAELIEQLLAALDSGEKGFLNEKRLREPFA